MRCWRFVALLSGLIGCGASPPPAPSRSSVHVPAASEEVSDSLCDRRARASELASEGDRALDTDVDAAVRHYEEAVELDPDNDRLLWKLALAHEKKEDWPRVAQVMSRAVEVAPAFASYWHKLGFAEVKQGAYAQAENPLRRCIEKDPNFFECHALLARVQEWTEREQAALQSYTKAIELGPGDGDSYLRLASLYFSLKLLPQARAVLQEGVSRVPSGSDNDVTLFRMYADLAAVAEAEADPTARLAALEKAVAHAGDTNPEGLFLLGRAHALMDPPRKQEAVSLLTQFVKRVCRGAGAIKFKRQCEETSSLLQRLGQ
ncbi:MAG TPA: tetratricopeptide repeat protein [Polyangiaceae bacterium]|jgi:tetratricopeptide (TPR) repeat protein|nr:tetratricopeptide repeat protein [Polyangiaceae bacterium]